MNEKELYKKILDFFYSQKEVEESGINISKLANNTVTFLKSINYEKLP